MTPANLGFVEMLLLPFSTVFYQPFCQYFISLTIHATSDWIENHFEENNRLQLISGKYLPRIENRTQAIFMCVIPQTVFSLMPASHGSRRDLAILAPPPNWWVPSPPNWVPSYPLPLLRDEQSRCFRVLITVGIGLADVTLAMKWVAQKHKYKEEDKDVNINIDIAWYLIQSITPWTCLMNYNENCSKNVGQNVEASSLTCSFSSSFFGKLISVNCPPHAH